MNEGTKHLCTQKVQLHEVFDLCHGISPMYMETCYTVTNDDMEYAYRWTKITVNYCPFCGLKADSFEKDC